MSCIFSLFVHVLARKTLDLVEEGEFDLCLFHFFTLLLFVFRGLVNWIDFDFLFLCSCLFFLGFVERTLSWLV